MIATLHLRSIATERWGVTMTEIVTEQPDFPVHSHACGVERVKARALQAASLADA